MPLCLTCMGTVRSEMNGYKTWFSNDRTQSQPQVPLIFIRSGSPIYEVV